MNGWSDEMEDSHFIERTLVRIREDLFNRPIMSNLARPHYVERMVALALEPDWKLVSADWAGWDLQRGDCKIEVKQAAALQSWSDSMSPSVGKNAGRFDVRARTGYWIDGATWNAKVGRHADIYIFAWHGGTDRAAADHRRASQWEFHIVAERDLPAQKTLSLSGVRRLAGGVAFAELRSAVERLTEKLNAESRAPAPSVGAIS